MIPDRRLRALRARAREALFDYDLSFLSSIARAFSFIAVGALLVVAGFFHQRLAREHLLSVS